MAVPIDQRLSTREKQLINSAVKAAELNSSGEIRVHLELKCPGNVLDRAAYIFEKLEMHKTALRNGILFYLSLDDRKFAVIGDVGIHQKVGDEFWQNIRDQMIPMFKEGKLAEGLRLGILKAGEQLKKHFPYRQDDINELDDEISYG